MIVVSVVIEHKSPQEGNVKDLKVECNLLKREDANEVEWQIAKTLEGLTSVFLKTIATKIVKEEHID